MHHQSSAISHQLSATSLYELETGQQQQVNSPSGFWPLMGNESQWQSQSLMEGGNLDNIFMRPNDN